MKKNLLFIFFLFLNFHINSNIILKDNFSFYKLSPYLNIYEDKTGSIKIKDINENIADFNNKFKKATKKITNFGLTKSVIWAYIEITNNSQYKENFLLEFTWPLFDDIEIYTNDENGKFYLYKKSGDLLLFYSREIDHRNFIFSLPVKKNTSKKYYIKIHGNDSMILDVNIWNPEKFYSYDRFYTFFLGLYFGLLIVMIFYNLIIFFSLKDISYIYFVCLLFFIMLFELSYTGLGFQFIWQNFPWFQQHALSFFMCLCIIFFLLFSRTFLDIKNKFKKVNLYLNFIILICFAIIIISLFINTRISITILNCYAVLIAFAALVKVTRSYRNDYKEIFSYILAWIPVIIFVPTLIFKNMGLLPSNFFTDNSLKFGISIQVVFLSLALGNKFMKEKEKSENAQKQSIETLKKSQEQLESFLLTLSDAIESKDSYTGGHVERVAKYSRDIAVILGLNEESIKQIYLGAIVHDVGKIGIKDLILDKRDKLSAEEFEEIKSHTTKGYKLLGRINGINIASKIVLHHQEKWDGSGYPFCLKGNDIPVEARIVTVADYWDALVTERPYRDEINVIAALEIMKSERNKAFDPVLFDIFMDNKIFLKYLSEAQLKLYYEKYNDLI